MVTARATIRTLKHLSLCTSPPVHACRHHHHHHHHHHHPHHHQHQHFLYLDIGISMDLISQFFQFITRGSPFPSPLHTQRTFTSPGWRPCWRPAWISMPRISLVKRHSSWQHGNLVSRKKPGQEVRFKMGYNPHLRYMGIY